MTQKTEFVSTTPIYNKNASIEGYFIRKNNYCIKIYNRHNTYNKIAFQILFTTPNYSSNFVVEKNGEANYKYFFKYLKNCIKEKDYDQFTKACLLIVKSSLVVQTSQLKTLINLLELGEQSLPITHDNVLTYKYKIDNYISIIQSIKETYEDLVIDFFN